MTWNKWNSIFAVPNCLTTSKSKIVSLRITIIVIGKLWAFSWQFENLISVLMLVYIQCRYEHWMSTLYHHSRMWNCIVCVTRHSTQMTQDWRISTLYNAHPKLDEFYNTEYCWWLQLLNIQIVYKSMQLKLLCSKFSNESRGKKNASKSLTKVKHQFDYYEQASKQIRRMPQSDTARVRFSL